MKRRVIVVDGPLAFRMKRVEAARASLLGLEVLSLPLLAARLAGGFRRFADRDLLAPAIAEALGEGNFKDIDSVKDLPGMVRAIIQTLDRVWTADIDLEALSTTSPRLSDLALIEHVFARYCPLERCYLGMVVTQRLLASNSHPSRRKRGPYYGALAFTGLVEIEMRCQKIAAAEIDDGTMPRLAVVVAIALSHH
jgi:hypothetical protein